MPIFGLQYVFQWAFIKISFCFVVIQGLASRRRVPQSGPTPLRHARAVRSSIVPRHAAAEHPELRVFCGVWGSGRAGLLGDSQLCAGVERGAGSHGHKVCSVKIH